MGILTRLIRKKYFLALLIIFIGSLFINSLRNRLNDNLDPSWQFTLNFASTHHLNFGKDIIFTYGPLGFVSYNVAEGLSINLMMFSWFIRLIFVIYFFTFLYEVVANLVTYTRASKDLSILIKYILVPFMVFKFGTLDYYLIIFICLIQACVIIILDLSCTKISDFFSHRKLLLSVFTGFTISLLFFIKVSLLPFILTLPVILIIKFLLIKEYKNLVAFLAAIIISFSLAYAYFNIDLKYYIINSLQIIAGYKNAMQMHDYSKYPSSYILSAVLIALYIVQFYFIRKSINISNITLLLIISLSLYFLFVYSYTRGSEGGMIYCWPCAVLIFYLIIYIIPSFNSRIRIFNIITMVLFISFITFSYDDFKHLFRPELSIKNPKILSIPIHSIKPRESYDVYPWNSSYCYFNHLKYNPRPVFQSYSAYTPKLDSINAAFFSAKKVDHIIFHGSNSNADFANAIDNRYFMFDEPMTKFEILKNYTITNKINDSTFIVSKRNAVIKTNLKTVKAINLKLNQEFYLDSVQNKNEIYYFTADFTYTPFAKLLSMIKRMPYIKVDLTLRSGRRLTFNVVPDLLKKPCILNKYCANYNNFFNLINYKNGNLSNDIKSMKFYPKGHGGFKNNFVMKIYKLDIM